jgi:hypothetical protein
MRLGQLSSAHIDPDHMPVHPNQLREINRHLPDAAADIGYAHSRLEAGESQETTGPRAVRPMQDSQTIRPRLPSAEHIAIDFHCDWIHLIHRHDFLQG